MFRKILIANRGEIAARVIRTAQAMGIGTVAVYSDADAQAIHVTQADEAVHIGPPQPTESYLNIPKIIAAAKASGAEAIHPGYGFLSENPDFVEACDAAALTFIGPSATAIRAMGLKDAAKRLMAEAGVPVVPGTDDEAQDAQSLSRAAERIGYPVLIKAVAGGGGKGMRLVNDASDFAAALSSARNEAAAAFGNDDVLVEKFIANPRHIEFQIFGDGTNAVHLYERDCSLQRRHQKVIEEAPAPGMTDEVRDAMGQAAVRAAVAIGYKGAGTVEFIVDGTDGLRPDRFWFMEMNTRLQVEHPVTEAITGIDLVEWQIRVASGEPLPAAQSDIHISGHAFEARIYAEDVPAGFLPATGTITHLKFPTDARIDSAVAEGDTISPFYDPMIAKLTTHGATRQVALSRLQRALADTELAGTTTNVGFLHALASQREFVKAQVHTGLIAEQLDELIQIPPTTSQQIAAAALAAIAPNSAHPVTGFSLWTPLRRHVTLNGPDGQVQAEVHFNGHNQAHIVLGDAQHTASWSDGQIQIDGGLIRYHRQARNIWLFGPNDLAFQLDDPLDRRLDSSDDSDELRAPMPGLVQSLSVQPGDSVTKGDVLLVLEAMKMEHGLGAPRDGHIKDVLVAPGDQIAHGALLIRLATGDEA